MKDTEKTENLLKIFWEGDEVSGITTYGYWKGKVVKELVFPRHLWPERTLFKTSRLHGEGWEVIVWDIRISIWPSHQDWIELIRTTLKSMVEAGAEVAWCGLEGFFADPPSLFDPNEMSGGVYATFSKEFGFQCSAHLGLPFKALSDSEVGKLRSLL